MSRTLGLRNRQRVHAVDTRLLRRIARWALEEQFHAADYELGLHLVTAAEMSRVNESFLDHEGSTDVITFDHREDSGPTSRQPSQHLRPGLRGLTARKTRRETGTTDHELAVGGAAFQGRAFRGPHKPRAALEGRAPAHESERRAPARLVASQQVRAERELGAPIADQELKARKLRSGITLHGEIFLCLDETVAQARQFGTDWQSELTRYLLHGLLHLHGFDDLTPHARRRMKRQENRLLRLAQRQFPLRRLAQRRR